MSRKRYALLALLGLLACGVAPADAAERQAVLTVELQVDGEQSWDTGTDNGRATTSERYLIVTPLRSDGELDSVNVLDPQFAERQMIRAAQVQRAVLQARGGAVTPPATEAEAASRQQALMLQMQARQQACGSDANCLMALAMEMTQQSAALSVASAPADLPSAAADQEQDEYRYLNFYGYEHCPGKIEIRIERSVEGEFADIAGMIPFRERHTADWRGDALQNQSQCLGQQTVFDTGSDRFYARGYALPSAAGTWSRSVRGRPDEHGDNAEMSADATVRAWLSEQLSVAADSGSISVELPVTDAALVGSTIPDARYRGAVRASLKWRFEVR
ncbi:MAG: hypothetical protein PHP86_05820 [Nevskiales bacterium]|nr:hypothetical protein [Nevskiales bacterium]